MCNGDLGMYRVMPWAYPTIPGQSSGGTTLDPTPEQPGVPEIVYPYDATDIAATWKSTSVWTSGTDNALAHFEAIISGIKVLDVSSVSSLKYTVTNQTLSITPTTLGGKTVTYILSKGNLTKTNPNSTLEVVIGKWVGAKNQSGNKATISGSATIKIGAYNSSGDLLQEFSVVVS